MKLFLRQADASDLPLLSRMNRQLIEDEGSTNPMSTEELLVRMKGWLQSGWQIDLLLRDTTVLGYALYQLRRNERGKEEVYLRQYFIERKHRGRGYGQAGIALLLETRWDPGHTIVVEVLETNPAGHRFWQRVGFAPYSTTLTRNG
ncbi:hypothetical protein XYCOK13_24600 [Xylanibacillus composti]|uniref:N-acetyltransferase domain-containing protein n=1 Tax=Xylanibacillus composti TaxID=1572762 RepID=A0A8J4M3L7_9BACL|nr:GNAT family N-acetyltransferase [Xylanibacillus composti]GIQ69636.1 hypothetical protein XYCOK13_24600 [Xylanibacillus composti]